MFKNVEQLRAYRDNCKELLNAENKKIIVCGGAGCVSKGANKVYEKLVSVMAKNGLNDTVKLEKCEENSIRLTKSGCHGFCEVGPLVRIEPQG